MKDMVGEDITEGSLLSVNALESITGGCRIPAASRSSPDGLLLSPHLYTFSA